MIEADATQEHVMPDKRVIMSSEAASARDEKASSLNVDRRPRPCRDRRRCRHDICLTRWGQLRAPHLWRKGHLH